MTNKTRDELVARETILKLLSDEETGRVSTAEGANQLPEGAEYLDLEHIDKGIQRATATTKVAMGHVLPRRAVNAGTWTKILAHLGR